MESNYFWYANRNAPTELKSTQIDDSLGPNEVLVRGEYAGLNPVDVKLKSIAFFWGARTLLDFSGTVIKAGSSVKQFKEGDAVCGITQQGAASLMKIDTVKAPIALKPKSLTAAEAAVLPVVYATAVKLIERGTTPTTESSVLVLGGATSVGSATIQLLKKHYKVKNVVASCSRDSADFVKGYGADQVLDYRASSFQQDLINAGNFANIYDCVGGREVVSMAGKLLEKGGWFVTAAGDIPPATDYSSWLGLNQLTSLPRCVLRSLFGSFWNVRWAMIFGTPEAFVQNAAAVDTSNIKVSIHKELQAREVQKAFELMNSPKPPRGKLVLKF